MVGIDPAPWFSVLPGLRFACKAGRPFEAQVELGDDDSTRPRVGYPALDVEPRGAPGRTPRIANLDRRELPEDGVAVGDRFASDAKGGQLETD